MTLREFISHLSHKSLKIKIMYYSYSTNYVRCFVSLYEGTVGSLLHWVKYPDYMNYIVTCVEPEDTNFLEVKIYG